jgi:N-methylhydantoinase B
MAIDPTTLAVLRRSLITIANEMGLTIAKVAYSPVISEGRDFTGAIFDARGHLVACGDHDLPGLLGTLEPTLAFVLTALGTEIQEGDVIACNSPHEAGTHLNDVRLVKPVCADGEIVAFVADLGHWTDVGGSVPGSINPLARDAYGEGLRITPVKIVDRGVYRRDVVEMILANVRLPHEANGDIWAQIKALDLGEARLHGLVERWSVDTLLAVFGLVQDHAEALFYARVDEIPDGSVEFEDFMDADPLDPERRPVRVHLKLTKEGRRLVFDFRDSDPQPRGGNGCPRPITQSGVYIATMNLFPGLPFNHGLVRNLEIVTEPGSAVHVTFPNPVSGCAAGGFEKVIACVLGCWGRLAPDRQVGSTFNLINVTLGGLDRRFDRPFVMYMWNEGGFGGGPDRDGGDAPGMSLFSPGSRNQPVELHERLFPILLTELEIAQDSAGPGRWRGCPGIRRSYRVLEAEAVLGVFGDRSRFKPWGVAGGDAGSGQTVFVNRGRPGERELGVLASEEPILPGDVVEVWSSGGGGYGDPRARDPELVLRDVRLGLVSRQAARDVYAVEVVCEDELADGWRIDREATARLRA